MHPIFIYTNKITAKLYDTKIRLGGLTLAKLLYKLSGYNARDNRIYEL